MKDARTMTRDEWTAFARAMNRITDGNEQEIADEVEDWRPGWLDQMGAAARESFKLTDDWAAKQDPGTLRRAAVPDRFRSVIDGQYLRLTTGLADGRTRHCEHVNLSLTVPVIALVHWDRIDCRKCWGKHGRPQFSRIEEFTCDLCREFVPDGCLDPWMVQKGPLVLVAAACRNCWKWVRSSPGGRVTRRQRPQGYKLGLQFVLTGNSGQKNPL